jgi:hypothetical protein
MVQEGITAMDIALDIGLRFGRAVGSMLMQPFYYIAILLVVLQYRRQIALERKLFHVRLHSLWSETWRAVLWGLAAGMAASVVMGAVGSTVQPEALILMWVIMLVLALFRFRWLCISYAVGILGVMQAAAVLAPWLSEQQGLAWLIRAVNSLSIPSLLAVTAILHVVEALLVRKLGSRTATPLFYEGKRGKLVGGFQLQSFWPVPLLLLVPMSGGSALPWTTLIGGDLWQSGWMFVPFPIIMGFSSRALTRLPEEKARRSSGLLLGYSAVVMAMAMASYVWPVLTIGASLLTILLHELVIWLESWSETQNEPRFIHSSRGLTVLAVLPNSPAAELGILPGEIITKVHGIPVRTREKLHEAMRMNAAFCKLEVINLAGQSKFLQRALYEGDHHQLGVVLAPDEDASYYVTNQPMGLIGYMGTKLAGLEHKARTSTSA